MDKLFSGSMMAAATASLYAIEHKDIVGNHFEELYSLLVSSFEDSGFVEKLRSLKPGGMVTRGIPLKPESESLCFANKLWFRVQKSTSSYFDLYYVGIGVNFRSVELSPLDFKKLWIARAAAGKLEEVRVKINAPDFKDRICECLSEHVYESCYDSVCKIL